jgi:maltose alpha-D-glucosyltransferase/alpha-amylase
MNAAKINPGTPQKNLFWYKSGVIYELHVRAFCDSNADGTGDFPGLTSKLDYLRDLGVSALWLLPFYPSPLKDDGYDIADYYDVHRMYGTLTDFKIFLREAHKRNLRVITELVMNHTSDQHPWFQRARRAPPGNKFRDYYVWNDSPEKYLGTRIIFKDTEISNWTWDATANAFYWHRFFSHQPDLNFDNPVVHDEMIKILDFWFDLGVDGVRLDAVPYLYEREGTSCENLPETHEFLKKIRAHVDEKYGDRMLLAEANQWPEDAVAYFGSGKGDECQMAFHFPLMPRLFMALRMEDRVPVVDILQQTPPIPETAQWALFLRNHDELTLEMVTDEERDYMYRMYAHVQQARLNLGIRRRLAPLVGNDRKRIELLTALLFALPGTPVIYYGDEIGMGENIYLGDRNGVRTPMQWSADKNAGFSRANPQSLFLPINLDPENHYEAVNVEVQERNPHSLLWSMKRLIALHKRWKAFGTGSTEFLQPENRKILAFIRRNQNECVLVVANLSRFVQPVELDLSAFQSRKPVEIFGHTEFPEITDKPYFLTLGPHAFFWFSLEEKISAQSESAKNPVVAETPTIALEENWDEIFQDRNRAAFERALQNWLPTRRWFAGKNWPINNVALREIISLPGENGKAFLTFVQVEYIQHEPEIYLLPLAAAFDEAAENVRRNFAPFIIAQISINASQKSGLIFDGIADKNFCAAILKLIATRGRLPGNTSTLEASTTSELSEIENLSALEPVINKSEQINSSIVYGDKFFLKLFRKLASGLNPDLEIGRFLTAQKFPYSPALAGALESDLFKDEPITLGILSTLVPGAKDGWEFTLDALGRFYERIQTLPPEKILALPASSIFSVAKLADENDSAKEIIGTYLASAEIIGERTAALHIALAANSDDPQFAPEPFTPHSQRSLFQSIRNLIRQNFQLLDQQLKKLPAEIQPLAQQVLALEPEILKRLRAIYDHRIDAWRIRVHGDYHLGQLLYTGKDFLIVDFEGEPSLAISERRLKRSPLLDVAGMIRSFHYAAHAAFLKQIEHGTLPPAQINSTLNWGKFWAQQVSAAFFKAYRDALKSTGFLPANENDAQILLHAHLLRTVVYELGYELNNRLDWIKIPLQGILELMQSEISEPKKL